MPSPSMLTARAGLRRALQPLSNTRGSTTTGALVAAAAVAVGGYALYTSRTAAHAEEAGGKPPFGSFGFRTLKLSSAEMVNHDVKRLRFDLADPKTKSGLKLTSALLTISFPGGGWIPTLRPYTPVNDLDEPGHIDFLVKHYPGGKQSTHLHSMKEGDSLTFLRIPAYSWKSNEQEHIGLVAGGQGITPCYQLARGILRDPDEKTRVTLVWGVNTDDDLILARELDQMEKDYPGRFHVIYTISRPVSGSKYPTGYVTKELLARSGVVPDGVGKVFVCGPPSMEKALTGNGGVLGELGYTKKQIHKF